MICVYSQNEQTKVINSRAAKKRPVVWRRRQGVQSGTTFTTYERPSLAENKQIQLTDGAHDTFNLGKLIISIAASFSHNQHAAEYDSLWLAQTVEEILSMESEALTPLSISSATYETLKRFDELAAVQYAARHHLISTTKRRGRPSISENA
jgi:transcriptional regulator NrdR family protein